MKNIYSYIVIIPIVLLSLIPGIDFKIPMPTEGLWFWYVLIAGFLGFYTLFINTNSFVKIIAIGSFISCFFSSAPYFSFTAYISIIASCYFFILCSKIQDWQIIFRGLQAIMLLNVFIILMQAISKDAFLNFGRIPSLTYGTICQTMQAGSLSVVLTSALISFSAGNFIFPFIVGLYVNSQWTLLCAGLGVLVYFFRDYTKFASTVFIITILIFTFLIMSNGKTGNLTDTGRRGVWKKSIQLTNQHPIVGWGPGSYQYIFPALSGMTTTPWKTAHNDFVQILFELGYPGLILMILIFFWLIDGLIRAKAFLPMTGVIMLLADMQVHFPLRCLQIVPIILVFLAYCDHKIKEAEA